MLSTNQTNHHFHLHSPCSLTCAPIQSNTTSYSLTLTFPLVGDDGCTTTHSRAYILQKYTRQELQSQRLWSAVHRKFS